MSYDPFCRGVHPVGVVTFQSKDEARARELPLEIWYPAVEAERGRDLDPRSQATYRPLLATAPLCQAAVRDAEAAPGPHPVVAFSHGFAGHRCQSTFLCTHLASHGFLVVAPDHVGNTTMDVIAQALEMFQSGAGMPGPAEMMERIHDIAELRPGDVQHALDQVLSGAIETVPAADASRVAVSGHSFGGWTTLMTAGRDPRVRAAVPLAPAGGQTDLPVDPFAERMDLAWEREIPTLYLVAERDSLLPLRGMHELFERTRAPRRMVILTDTDHQHFCDNAEQIHELMRALPLPGLAAEMDLAGRMLPFSELAPAAGAEQAIRGLALAHLDAVLNGHEGARTLLDDAVGALAERGTRASTRA